MRNYCCFIGIIARDHQCDILGIHTFKEEISNPVAAKLMGILKAFVGCFA